MDSLDSQPGEQKNENGDVGKTVDIDSSNAEPEYDDGDLEVEGTEKELHQYELVHYIHV